MPEIIKRSGNRETFSMDKIKLSISASSDEAKQPLTESDLDRITADLREIVEGKTTLSTRQITAIVAGLLYTKGYRGVAEQYVSFKADR